MLQHNLSSTHKTLNWKPFLVLPLVVLLVACGVFGNPLQGKWECTSVDAPGVLMFGLCSIIESTGKGGVIEFRSDNTVILGSLVRTYKIMDNNRLVVNVPICGDVMYKYAITGNELTIQRENVTLYFKRK